MVPYNYQIYLGYLKDENMQKSQNGVKLYKNVTIFPKKKGAELRFILDFFNPNEHSMGESGVKLLI